MNSCVPVHPLAETEPVAAAVCNVAERSFFAFAEPVDPSMADVPFAMPAFSADVRFSGPASGQMRVLIPVALTRELAEMFSGDPGIQFTPEDLIDMAGEFTNMVTGAWLTSVDTSATFDLTAPSVVELRDAPAAPAADASLLTMAINGQPVGLTWTVE